MTQFKKENINDVLEEAVRVLEPEMKKGRIQLVMKLNRRIPEFLLDAEKMHQAFVNIVKNAIQSMVRGGILKIQTDLKGRVCEIRFKDQGVGIPKKVLPHVFEAYYTTKEEGSGLGLVVVHSAVNEHGGRIDIKSKVGEGTEFTLLLPLRNEKLPLPGAVSEKELAKSGGAKG
jgi:signal transduction histidine kinase